MRNDELQVARPSVRSWLLTQLTGGVYFVGSGTPQILQDWRKAGVKLSEAILQEALLSSIAHDDSTNAERTSSLSLVNRWSSQYFS